MKENKEIILVGKETRQAIKRAIEVGGIEEAQRLGLNVDTIKEPDPFEIVVYDGEEESKFKEAREWLDAMCLICLPIWMEQLRTFGIKDSNYWMMVRNEREAKKNE